MDQSVRLANELAEIALDSNTLDEYRRATLERLHRALGCDLATLYSSHSGACGHGFDDSDERLSAGLANCVLYFMPDELQRMSSGRAVVRESVFTPKRLDALRDVPLSFASAKGLAHWANPTRAGSVVGLLAVREHGRAFKQADLALIDAVTPVLRLAERIHVDRAASSIYAWADDIGLTRRQADVVDLVARGLRNREIAGVLHCSELTVRNHLVVAFRKAGVQTRQELVFQATTHERSTQLLPGFAYAIEAIAAAGGATRA